MSPVADRTGNSLVVYGDSIAQITNNPGWTAPLTAMYPPGQFFTDATAGRSLGADAAGMGIAALASELYAFIASGANRRLMLLFIGTNDFGLSVDSAAAFGTSYGQLLDAIHALDPSVLVYCATPLFRLNEATPNSFGNVLDDYRAAIAVAQATRGWSVLVDAAAWLNAGDLNDGLHPNATGYAKIVTRIRALLGF